MSASGERDFPTGAEYWTGLDDMKLVPNYARSAPLYPPKVAAAQALGEAVVNPYGEGVTMTPDAAVTFLTDEDKFMDINGDAEALAAAQVQTVFATDAFSTPLHSNQPLECAYLPLGV